MVYFYQLLLNTDDVILKLYTSLCQKAKCTLFGAVYILHTPLFLSELRIPGGKVGLILTYQWLMDVTKTWDWLENGPQNRLSFHVADTDYLIVLKVEFSIAGLQSSRQSGVFLLQTEVSLLHYRYIINCTVVPELREDWLSGCEAQSPCQFIHDCGPCGTTGAIA